MKQAAISDLETHTGFWLRFVSNHVSHAFARKLAARGVTVAEWVTLRALHDCEAMAPSDLATELGMTRGAISKLVDRLIIKHLATRAPGKGDRRYQQVGLTQAGRALVPELARLADANDAEFFGHLAPDQREAVEAMLRDVVRRHGLTLTPTD